MHVPNTQGRPPHRPSVVVSNSVVVVSIGFVVDGSVGEGVVSSTSVVVKTGGAVVSSLISPTTIT